jgi:hypothetical protein
MYDNINEIETESQEKSHPSYKFKDEPVQLLYVSEDIIEPTTDGIDLLSALKNEKLCVVSLNGPQSSGKSFLANNIINQNSSGFKVGEKTEGIWIWGNPITLENGSKLLVLDCQGLNKDDADNMSHKMFILSVLLSTCLIYNTKEELNDSAISDFIYYTDLANKIKVVAEQNDKINNIDNLKEYFPQLFFVNNTLEKEKIQELIETNPLSEKVCKLFEKRSYFNSNNLKELVEKIQKEINYKVIDNNIIDGDSLFGLIQNYVDFINDKEIPIIHSALENVILSKANKLSETIFEQFKDSLYKKVKYPMSITVIYKTFFELQQKYSLEFCQKVDKNLAPIHTGEYIHKIYDNMEKELEKILETNKDFYDEWFNMEYKNFEQELSKLNLESIEQIKLFILSYSSTFKNCLQKFLSIPNNDFCQNLVNVLLKIFQEFVVSKLTSIGDKINDIYENYSKECNNNIDSLNSNNKNLNEQIDNYKKLLDDKNKEKSEANKNYIELETKLDNLTRKLKEKEQEYENNIIVENQNYQKMELYNNTQIKEKDQIISNLKSKIEKLNRDILDSNKDSLAKVNELNRENIKLQSEIERLKKQDGKGKSDVYNEQSQNLQALFKNIQSTFMEFKDSVDKLDKENENVFKTKYLENSTKEIEEKLNKSVTEIKAFCDKQVKSMNQNYEKEIKKVKDKFDQVSFELDQKKSEENKYKDEIELNEKKLKGTEKQINELKEISISKDNLVQSQTNELKIYEKKIVDDKKLKEDLELSLAKNIYNFKMKEDEFDTLLMVIESIISKKKDKYEYHLGKCSNEVKNNVQTLIKKHKFFK